MLHDLIMEYLQQSKDCQQLNKNLIDGYRKYCDGKWWTYPQRDHYYFQYLIHHAIKAKDDTTIQEIMTDFKWMNVKLRIDNTIYHLRTDMEKTINYFRSKNNEVYLFCIDLHLRLDIISSSVYTRRNQRYCITYLLMIKIWNDYQQLVQLLQKHESRLPIKSIDLLQVLLTIDVSFNWIKERALQLAKENDGYWKITK